MKIKLSKSQWEFLGNKAGWIKTASLGWNNEGWAGNSKNLEWANNVNFISSNVQKINVAAESLLNMCNFKKKTKNEMDYLMSQGKFDTSSASFGYWASFFVDLAKNEYSNGEIAGSASVRQNMANELINVREQNPIENCFYTPVPDKWQTASPLSRFIGPDSKERKVIKCPEGLMFFWVYSIKQS